MRDEYQVLGDRILLIGDGRRGGKSSALWCLAGDKVEPVTVGGAQFELKRDSLLPVGNGRDYFLVKEYQGKLKPWRLDGASAAQITGPDPAVEFNDFMQSGDDLVGIAAESSWAYHRSSWVRLKLDGDADVKLHAVQRGNFVRYLPMALEDLIVDVDPDRNLDGIAAVAAYKVDGGKATALKFDADLHPVDIDFADSTLYVTAWRVAEDGARKMLLLARDGDSWKEQTSVSAQLKDDSFFVFEGQASLLTVYEGATSRAFRFSGGELIAVKLPGDGMELTGSAGWGQSLFCSFAPGNIEAIAQQLGRVDKTGEVVVATDAGSKPLSGSDWDINASAGGCYARCSDFEGSRLYYLPAEAR